MRPQRVSGLRCGDHHPRKRGWCPTPKPRRLLVLDRWGTLPALAAIAVEGCDESYAGHLVRYNRSFARSVRFFSPTVGYLDGSRCGKICRKNASFLLTASLDQSFWHFIKTIALSHLQLCDFFCALLLFLCALMSLHIFFFENLCLFFQNLLPAFAGSLILKAARLQNLAKSNF